MLEPTRPGVRDGGVPETDHRIAQLGPCLEAYGVAPRGLAWLTRGVYADVYKAETEDATLVVRIRAPEVRPEEVIFARRWAEVVSSKVEVAMPLRPHGDVPLIENRCVEVAPYIANTGYKDAGPDAWVTIGRWLGCMHRLARAVEDEAPVALPRRGDRPGLPPAGYPAPRSGLRGPLAAGVDEARRRLERYICPVPGCL